MPLVQYTIADENGVSRGTAKMAPPRRITSMDAWFKSATQAIKNDFKGWHTFKSYATTNTVFFYLEYPSREFRATVVIDRNQ